MATNENLIPIPGRLHSVAIEGHIAGADEIFDDSKGENQETINDGIISAIGSDSVPNSIKGRIKTLEVAISEGGSVPAMMDEKINALDAEISQQAGADGLSLLLQEIDGKITQIHGSIAPNTYDNYGAAATVKDDLLGDAAQDYNTLGKLEDKIQEEVTARQNAVTNIIGDAASEYNTLGKLEDRIQEEAAARTTADDGLNSRLTTVESKIPSEASSSNRLTDKNYVDTLISTEQNRATNAENLLQSNIEAEQTRAEAAESSLSGRITAEENRAKAAEQVNSNDIDAIEEKIPSQASVNNQLADKEFVNSSIATATATFRGTSVAGLTEQEFLQWADNIAVKDNNDYIFWNTVDNVGNVQFKKYKYDGTNWVYEYTLNNSSFTAEQWAAINSGLTAGDKTKLNGIEGGAQVNIIETVSVNNTPLIPVNKAIDIDVPTQLSQLAEDTTHRLVTDTEKATWNAKQDAIADLQTIREGAALGATAYQKPNAGIPSSDMTTEVQSSLDKADSAYQKPQSGIPESDLDTSTQNKLNAGNTAYQLPSGGIPKTDLDTNVQGSLSKADTALQEHQSLSDYYTKTETDNLLDNKQDTLTIDTIPTEGSGNPISSGAVNTLKTNTENALDAKANKSELQITPDSEDNSKAVIQLKENTSTQVIIEHQDISGKADKTDTYTKAEVDYKIDQAISGGGDLQNYYTKIEVDSKLSDKANLTDLADVATSGDYEDLINKPSIPTIPTNISAFVNDVGYLTEHQDISGKQDVLVFATVLEAEAAAYELT